MTAEKGAAVAIGLAVLSYNTPASAQPSFQSEIVAAHNRYRQAVQVPSLRWDPALAAGAAAWARRLGRARFEHSPVFARSGEGENLWMGTAGAFGIADMVAAWGAEQRDFIDGFVPDVSRTGEFTAVAHYTQVVWRDTSRVGCGLAWSSGWEILVCRYAAEGNVYGQLVY